MQLPRLRSFTGTKSMSPRYLARPRSAARSGLIAPLAALFLRLRNTHGAAVVVMGPKPRPLASPHHGGVRILVNFDCSELAALVPSQWIALGKPMPSFDHSVDEKHVPSLSLSTTVGGAISGLIAPLVSADHAWQAAYVSSLRDEKHVPSLLLTTAAARSERQCKRRIRAVSARRSGNPIG